MSESQQLQVIAVEEPAAPPLAPEATSLVSTVDSPQVPAEAVDKAQPVCLSPAGIVDIVLKAGTQLFLNQYSTPFAWVPVHYPVDHWECCEVRSKNFLSRVLALIEDNTDDRPDPSDIKRATEMLELLTIRSGRRPLANRMSFEHGRIYIDSGDDSWQMIEVDDGGWRVRNQDQPRFFRVRHHKPLCNPIPGGDPDALFEFVPVENEGERILLLAWVISAFHPGVPSPILMFVGQQGSAVRKRDS